MYRNGVPSDGFFGGRQIAGSYVDLSAVCRGPRSERDIKRARARARERERRGGERVRDREEREREREEREREREREREFIRKYFKTTDRAST
jgi:hypothetical protein